VHEQLHQRAALGRLVLSLPAGDLQRGEAGQIIRRPRPSPTTNYTRK
jgi:hypothetical protein